MCFLHIFRKVPKQTLRKKYYNFRKNKTNQIHWVLGWPNETSSIGSTFNIQIEKVGSIFEKSPVNFGPLIYNAGLSVTESASSERYRFALLPWYIQLYYRPTTTTLNRETQLQVAENYLSEQPAHLLLGLHCENRPE